MAINVFVPKFHTEEILKEIKECLEKGWTGLGFKTVAFENVWKDYSGVNHAHFLNSSTAGLHLAVNILKRIHNWKDGDEIITTPFTFVSPNHAILYEKLTPIFADIDEFLCLDPEDVERKITSRTRAIMYVGIAGNTGKYQRIIDLCKKHKLKLILDAAHMSGTKFRGKHVGPEADVAVFSYQAVKNLPTADSGMICFQDEELDKLARQMSWLGISKDTFQRFEGGNYKWDYNVPVVGYKYHGNSIMASIALVQLKYLDDDNAQRNELANYYIEALSNVKNISIVPIAPDCLSSRHIFQVLVKNRDKMMQYLYDHDIYPGVHYKSNTNYDMYKYARNTCKTADMVSDSVISLPLHLNLSISDLNIVIDTIKKANTELNNGL